MRTINIKVSKASVYDEVSKTTSYIGAKASEDGKEYERTFVTDDDYLMLERFWSETCDIVSASLRRYIDSQEVSVGDMGIDMEKDYNATLSVADAFNDALLDNLNNAMFSFFVSQVTAKWMMFVGADVASVYLSSASDRMNEVTAILTSRKRPTR